MRRGWSPPCAAAAVLALFGVAGAGLLPREELPLRTQGRYIIGRGGSRVKWACVNWYGAHSETSVAGGLEVRPLRQIVERIVELGFNCVRLCYSTQAHVENPLVEAQNVAANPEFRGKRFLDVWDATVEALTSEGLMVIINNQVHKSGWCCHYTQAEGLWYQPGYPESLWIESLVNMTVRYRSNPMVVAIDLRNEVHDYGDTVLTWGDGDPKTDWAAAATRAGNAVLAADPDVLIVVMALCFGMELRPARQHPIQLSLPDRVVYQTHNYLEYQFWSLVSESVMSWQDIRLICGFTLLIPIIVLWLVWSCWNQLGRPCPKRPVYAIHFGWWLCGISLVTVAICKGFLVLLSMNPGCGYWGRRDVMPTLSIAAALSALGCIVAVLGTVYVRHPSVCTAGKPGNTNGDAAHVSGLQELANAGAVSCAAGAAGAAVPPGACAACGIGPGPVREEESDEPDEEEGDDSEGLPGRPAPAGWEAVPPGRCCAPGCRSASVAWARATGKAPSRTTVVWDCGLCCAFQCCTLCTLSLASLLALLFFGFAATSYGLLEQHLDRSWGFVLEEGRSYTAPVWMGEFGNSVPGEYWNDFVHYLSKRDIDFAYWAINGLKYATGYIDITNGAWVAYDSPRWVNETFGVLKDDYRTVRSAWRLLDLQALSASPAQWRPQAVPCDRQYWGGACGG